MIIPDASVWENVFAKMRLEQMSQTSKIARQDWFTSVCQKLKLNERMDLLAALDLITLPGEIV